MTSKIQPNRFKEIDWYYDTKLIIPKFWDVFHLTELCKIVKSGVKKYEKSKYYVETGDMANEEIISMMRYTFDERPSRANMEVEIDDILFAKMKHTNKIFKITSEEKDFLFSTGFAVLRPNKEKIHPQYLLNYLNTYNFQKVKDIFCVGGTQKSMNTTSCKDVKIILPSLEIQKIIISRTSEFNNMMLNSFNFTSELFNLKLGLVQKLLTKGINHKKSKKFNLNFPFIKYSMPEEWELLQLSDISVKISDGEHNSPKFSLTGIPYISAGNVKNAISFEDCKFVDEETYEKIIKRCNPEFNDILFSIKGTLGTIKKIDIKDQFVMDRDLALIKLDLSRVNPTYLEHVLKSYIVQKQINAFSNNAVIPSLYLGNLKKILVPLPSISEQKEMVSILSNIDEQINSEILYREQIRKLKNGIMQKILTGEIVV